METNNSKEEIKEKKINIPNCNIGIFTNMVFAVLVMESFIALNLVYTNCSQDIFQIFTKVAYMEFLAIAIIFIEIAYKRESGRIAIYGIEYIAVAIYLLLLERINTSFNFNMQNLIVTSSLGFAIYYTLKSIIIDTNERRKQLKQISDVKEIVKEEKPTKKLAKKRKV